MEQYTADYFIGKFQSIPDNFLVKGVFSDSLGGHCANGWCGASGMFNPYLTDESRGLQRVFSSLQTAANGDSEDYPDYSNIAANINNGHDDRYQQPTPKQRILAALYDIKKMQEEQLGKTIPNPYETSASKQLATEANKNTVEIDFPVKETQNI